MTDAAPSALAVDVLSRLASHGWTVGVAESLTGGLVVAELVAVPGASAMVRGGVVAYATDLKQTLLGVDASLLAAEGPVHPEVATQMAAGVRVATGADVGLATTGAAGPDPQGGRAVGTVFVAVVTPDGAHVTQLALQGSRSEIRAASVRAVLDLALSAL